MTEYDSDNVLEGETPTSIDFDDERVIWEGGPSQIVNMWNYIRCISVAAVASYFLWRWHFELSTGYENLTPFINMACQPLIVISLLLIIYFYLDVSYERTIITYNKIAEEKGITRIFRQELLCEISDIRDIKSPPPGIILGMFGLSNLVIETNDDDQPIILIRAIGNREEIIENLLPIWRRLKLERKGFFADR